MDFDIFIFLSEPYAEVHEVKSFVHELCCCKTIGKEEVGQMLETVHSKRNREEGVFHISNQPWKRTKFNYKTLAAKVASTTLTIQAVVKTQVREVAEKSFQSTVSFLMTCSTTLLQIGEVQPGPDKVIKATGGAQTLERLVPEANENVQKRKQRNY